MAYQLEWTGRKTGHKYLYYNLTHPVGLSAGSTDDDTMLIQALFRVIFYEVRAIAPPSGLDGIAVDGKCGNITQTHMRAYKQWMRRNGMPTVADGKIDPIEGNPNEASTPLHHDRYVLETLNYQSITECEKKGLAKRRDFHSAPREDIPEPLFKALQTRGTVLNWPFN
ncbi:hypothetical protein BH10PSE18_BH10PSE18_30670 [soil metagenome]